MFYGPIGENVFRAGQHCALEVISFLHSKMSYVMLPQTGKGQNEFLSKEKDDEECTSFICPDILAHNKFCYHLFCN